jgi:hypothetical protein
MIVMFAGFRWVWVDRWVEEIFGRDSRVEAFLSKSRLPSLAMARTTQINWSSVLALRVFLAVVAYHISMDRRFTAYGGASACIFGRVNKSGCVGAPTPIGKQSKPYFRVRTKSDFG